MEPVCTVKGKDMARPTCLTGLTGPITIDGVDCYEYGLIVMSGAPGFTVPPMRESRRTIPGRSGERSLGTFHQPHTFTLVGTLLGDTHADLWTNIDGLRGLMMHYARNLPRQGYYEGSPAPHMRIAQADKTDRHWRCHFGGRFDVRTVREQGWRNAFAANVSITLTALEPWAIADDMSSRMESISAGEFWVLTTGNVPSQPLIVFEGDATNPAVVEGGYVAAAGFDGNVDLFDVSRDLVSGSHSVSFGVESIGDLTSTQSVGVFINDPEQSGGAGDSILISRGTAVDVANHMGSCLSLDGNGYASITDGSQTGLDIGTSDFMVEAWVKFTNAATAQRIVAKMNTGLAGYDVFFTATNARLGATIRDGGGVVISTDDGASLNDGNWHHIAVVFDRSGNMTRYVDGSVYGTADDISARNLSLDHGLDFRIGCSSAGTQYYTGSVDEVRVWDYGVGGLPADIATAIAEHAACPYRISERLSAGDLQGRWSFDGDVLTDSSGNGNTLTGSGVAYATNYLVSPMVYTNIDPHQGTLEIVFRPNWDSDSDVFHDFFGEYGTNSTRNAVRLFFNNGALYFRVYDDEGTDHGCSANVTSVWSAGEYVYICCRWDRNNAVTGGMYTVMDVGVSSLSQTSNGTTAGGWIMGAVDEDFGYGCSTAGASVVDGLFRMQICDEALTDAEVTAHFSSGAFVEPCADHRTITMLSGEVTSGEPDFIQFPQTVVTATNRNLVVDGNMEDGDRTHWEDLSGGNVSVYKDRSTLVQDTQSMRLVVTAAGTKTQRSDAITVSAGQNYWLGGWIHSNDLSSLTLTGWDLTGGSAILPLQSTAGAWEWLEGCFEIPAGCTDLRAYIIPSSSVVDEKGWVDGVRIHRNYMPNSGFETWTAGDPDGYVCSDSGTMTQDTTDEHTGTSCCELVLADDETFWVDSGSALSLSQNTWYTYSAWLKGDSGGEDIQLSVGSTFSDVTGNTAETFTLTTDWVKYEITFKTGNDSEGRPKLINRSGGSATFYVDDVAVIECDSVSQDEITGTSSPITRKYQLSDYGQSLLIPPGDTLSWSAVANKDEGTILVHLKTHFGSGWTMQHAPNVLVWHGDASNDLALYYDVSEDKWTFRKKADGTSYRARSDVMSFGLGQTYTLVCTYGANGVKLYVDGAVGGTTHADTDALDANPSTLYMGNQEGDRYPHCRIDMLYAWGYEMSAEEVRVVSTSPEVLANENVTFQYDGTLADGDRLEVDVENEKAYLYDESAGTRTRVKYGDIAGPGKRRHFPALSAKKSVLYFPNAMDRAEVTYRKRWL